MPDQRVIEIYRVLSDIEDNFKVSKSDLDIRPVYVSREDGINVHVLTCLICMIILRLIQKKTDHKFTPEQIISRLKNISFTLEHENVYLFDYHSNIYDEIGKAFGTDFTNRRLCLNDIKNILATSKKCKFCYVFMAKHKARKLAKQSQLVGFSLFLLVKQCFIIPLTYI